MKLRKKEFFRKTVIPFFLGYTLKGVISLLAMTCRFRILGTEKLHQSAKNSKCILIAWHNRLGIITEILKRTGPQYRYAAMVSNSRDGQFIAVIANSYKEGRAIKVPHNQRAQALQMMINQLKSSNEIGIVTPDGPRGPKYTLKPGVALAARKCNAQVIPLSWSANRFWKFNTWDGMMLPKPFSTITVQWGNPVTLGKTSETTVEQDAQQLEHALLAITNDRDPNGTEKAAY
ncbi:lysophospholipid acyltransferase family protein [Waddlia chondrophila]|uniref:DUF374 domain-containing protein n=1 Tax=Waddlia chondrophila (strain ATCC VR-1470 / WSU 86-1044) TaxID=716544 RepID=D6YUH0_WADCW|nr:DUF374 domain-containing protein [Waddlia chondrophila]ADI37781.1 hypothetical protein wcw_0409 [Waddlia chondrophila WSU 86-1044]